ncbi:hypothetical protein HHI36_007539 [Cryptolaemus montrouzieri]|uniref:Uncharacterized protein n=1 Tax=Cryptolaemus montrouzieri TaxID=559131 RepID=A0ABD2MPZ4_9CUCU
MQHHFYFDPLHVKRGTEYPRKQDLCYNPSTVVGNWFEERLAYKKNRFKHTTSYLSQFFPKPYSRVSPNVVWSEKFKSDLANPIVHSKDGCWDYPNFFENFASTYDLSFNHYPKWYNNIGHIDRKLRFRMSRFEPMEDYIDSFHNITRHGLLETKKEEWCLDKSGPHTTQRTHNQDVYKKPSQEDYKFTRHAPPKSNSSKLYESNKNAFYQTLRDGVPAYGVVPNFDLVQVPHQSRCDPITWECPKKYSKHCPK